MRPIKYGFFFSVSSEHGHSKEAMRLGLVHIQTIFKGLIKLSKDSMKDFIVRFGPRGKFPLVCCSVAGANAALHKYN